MPLCGGSSCPSTVTPRKTQPQTCRYPSIVSIYTVLGLARFNELWWGSERPTDNRTFERSLGIRIDTLFWFLLNFLLTFASPAIYYHISGPAQSNPNLCVIFKYFLNISAARTSHSKRNWKVPRKWQMLYLCMFFKQTTHTHTHTARCVCVLCRWSVWKINCETRCFCTSCNNSWKTPNKTNLTNCKISYCDCVCHCVSLQLCTQVLSTSLSLSISLSTLSLSLFLCRTHTHMSQNFGIVRVREHLKMQVMKICAKMLAASSQLKRIELCKLRAI